MDETKALAALAAARPTQADEEEPEASQDPFIRFLEQRGLSTDEIRAFLYWMLQRGMGKEPGPDLSPFVNPGESDMPGPPEPPDEGMYPRPVYPPGYEERGRLRRIPPPRPEWERPPITRM